MGLTILKKGYVNGEILLSAEERKKNAKLKIKELRKQRKPIELDIEKIRKRMQKEEPEAKVADLRNRKKKLVREKEDLEFDLAVLEDKEEEWNTEGLLLLSKVQHSGDDKEDNLGFLQRLLKPKGRQREEKIRPENFTGNENVVARWNLVKENRASFQPELPEVIKLEAIAEELKKAPLEKARLNEEIRNKEDLIAKCLDDTGLMLLEEEWRRHRNKVKRALYPLEKKLGHLRNEIQNAESEGKEEIRLEIIQLNIQRWPCIVGFPLPDDLTTFCETQMTQPVRLHGLIETMDSSKTKIPKSEPISPGYSASDSRKEAYYRALKSFERRVEDAKKRIKEQEKEIIVAFQDWKFYVFKGNLYCFADKDLHNDEERLLLIKEHYFKEEKKFNRLKKDIRLFEKLEEMDIQESREPIPEEVRFSVWRRDGGKCVKCGSKRKLEFDHIIPVSKGGGNTERNIQILCEHCNREKSDRI